LPLRILLAKAPATAFLIRRVFRYRYKVVSTNLQRAFPEKTPDEIAQIRHAFYRHLSEVILESIHLLRAKEEQIQKRCPFTDEGKALLQDYYDKGQSVICMVGHLGNWEWTGPAFRYNQPFLPISAYHPLSNRVFNWLIVRIRMRYAHALIPMDEVARTLLRMKTAERPMVMGLIADQSPPRRHAYWLPFLNQETAFFSGPEKLAKKLKMPMVFIAIRKQGPGRYQLHAETITNQPHTLPDEEITLRYAQMLEKEIQHSPATWLWSHRRWKKQKLIGNSLSS
jgi:Kdo2-lipid IVA lauroyltransferase/acyltransferase